MVLQESGVPPVAFPRGPSSPPFHSPATSQLFSQREKVASFPFPESHLGYLKQFQGDL